MNEQYNATHIALNCGLNDNMQITTSTAQNYQGNQAGLTGSVNTTATYFPSGTTAWDYWQNWYYPQVIYQSYPVYIRERAMDKGKQAFEIIKILKDKKLVKLEKVGDFIDLMDELIKIL